MNVIKMNMEDEIQEKDKLDYNELLLEVQNWKITETLPIIQRLFLHLFREIFVWKFPIDIYEYNGTVKNKESWRIDNSDSDAGISFKIPILRANTYKVIIVHGSTEAKTINGQLRVGRHRIGQTYNNAYYMDWTTFNLEHIIANQVYKTSSANFEVENDMELLIVDWQKTADNGTGQLGILLGLIKEVQST